VNPEPPSDIATPLEQNDANHPEGAAVVVVVVVVGAGVVVAAVVVVVVVVAAVVVVAGVQFGNAGAEPC
jgi:hypothetical protein